MQLYPVPGGTQPAAPERLSHPVEGGRRDFLKWTGLAAATALLAGCDRTPTESGDLASAGQPDGAAAAGSAQIDLADDIGILNFAYALEQLEAAFYSMVVSSFYSGATQEEQQVLRDIKRHEVVHREFFQTALGPAAIGGLAVNFSAIDFGSRQSVLGTALAFEDLGVGAYNGAAQFVRNGDYLVAAGKIVSVEARHASAIRDLAGRSFAPNAFDPAFRFEQVLRKAAPFIATQITLKNSPTARHPDAQVAAEAEVVS